jgi:filamentous hemagglutinin
MKARRFIFRAPTIFGTPLAYGVPVFIGFTVLVTGLTAEGGDILRGGSAGGGKAGRGNNTAGASTPAATDAARANAKDALARTNRTLDAVRAIQNSARNAALANSANHPGKNSGKPLVNLPKVPNGMGVGGLQATTDPTKWKGANAPVQTVGKSRTHVTIKQNTEQALLEWQSFNVGSKTTLTFDQTAGGADSGKWIAFNKIDNSSGNPTQILGSIKATGQVYVINQNGVIFGGGSQVSARGLTVSSLPINENLIKRGLLNNPDSQFLFSGLTVPGGADGTPTFEPGPPPLSGKYGDVIVQAGAVLKSPAGSGGNGGRIMLVGPNVTNNGTISTQSGQTILAAGLQVGIAAHDSKDPSLRGLDVWVGAVGDYAGTVTNGGLIDCLTGSASMVGRYVNQLGVIDSSTSVSLNGRIDLKASYGAVGNPNFDSSTEQGAGGPLFLNQFTGVVTLGEKSATRILPDYVSNKSVPGISLPERSQINIEGLAVHFGKGSTVLAPNAEVSVRAGVWPYKDGDGNGTILDAEGKAEAGLSNYYSGTNQKFFFQGGQIFVDDDAVINVAGSVDVFVPLAQNILNVELRGSELADSPLQRDSVLRGKTLTVDIGNTGTYNGKYWIGTPLGDVTGLIGLIERNAAQLTAVGGNINLQAGGSVVVSKGAVLDVSGGYFNHEGGLVKTSYLVSGGRLIDIKDATPDLVYDGVFTGTSTFTSEKWGVVNTFDTPLFNGTMQDSYVEGAAGGTLSINAPSMALDGNLRGLTVEGPRQRTQPAGLSSLKISFEAEKEVRIENSPVITYIKTSPTPPAVIFGKNSGEATSIPAFALVGDAPASLPADRSATVTLSPRLLGDAGFGSLEVINPDGSITVPEDVTLSATPKGSIAFTGANISILGALNAAGGKLSFTTYNISPTFATEYGILNPAGSVPIPAPSGDRGLFTLAKGATLSTAGLIVDDSSTSSDLTKLKAIDGGNIVINSFSASLDKGSKVDVSGGVYVSEVANISYGNAGSISVVTGKDMAMPGVIGGRLVLQSKLCGFSGADGGSLNIQAGRIQIGGAPEADALNLDESFFRKGGFIKYYLAGIGAAIPGDVDAYLPAVSIAAGTQIKPRAVSYMAVQGTGQNGIYHLEQTVNQAGVRKPVSLGFSALGSDDPFTLDKLEVRGDITMGLGAKIITDPGASVTFKGGTVTMLGSVIAAGGQISITGANSFPLTAAQKLAATQALPTVHIGSAAVLSTAGVTQLLPEDFGLRTGTIYDGGQILVSGNILAESGALLDVSGTSGVLDLDPSYLGTPGLSSNAAAVGLTSTPAQRVGVATRIDSNGGLIDLSGAQMLLSDATLLGKSGGSTATGGSLSIFSGNYHREGETSTSADVNLVVTQGGNFILNPDAPMGVGISLTDASGASYGKSGYFAIDRFKQGEFSSLSLGGKYLSGGSPLPFGGNIDFQGKIDINATGSLRLAAGGVIRADDTVDISASYISVGQDFRSPQHPDDVVLAFQKDPAFPTNDHHFAPTFGSGRLNLNADLIDVGTISLQNIGEANLTAAGGDIRGNGTFSMAGDLILTAAQVYPTSLGKLDIFAYDHDGMAGSVTIKGSGKVDAPHSAGGSLSIYSSNIIQSGILRAPLGIIRLGWDGVDQDLSDADVDAPSDLIAGDTIAAPISQSVVLLDNSLTSVSGKGLKIPFGISSDGLSWIDPRGVNVTLSGMPQKAVYISGESVSMAAGSTVDIRGGGDLLASRWISGNGGSRDLLGTASTLWGAGEEYQPGDLVSYNGQTWSARVRQSGQTPGANLYWSKVEQSYAIVPTFTSQFAPYGAFNTGSNAGALGGAQGYVDGTLKVGDSITLEASDGLPAGTYTLLPRGYAILEGAYLVTPLAGGGVGTLKTADGSSFVSGYRTNAFNPTASTTSVRSNFEIASAAVLKNRVTYTVYSANDFIKKGGSTQLLPTDAGYAAFHGNAALELQGSLLAGSAGRGASVDISSFADIQLLGPKAVGVADGTISLQTDVLQSWGAESVLIGGVRSTSAGVTSVDVRTSDLTLDNSGSTFSGADITLVSREKITLADGAFIASSGVSSGGALLVDGDGALVRVSSDPEASVTRGGLAGSVQPLLTIGDGANIAGKSLTLDSTYGTYLSSNATIQAEALTLSSGQISVAFGDASGPLEGSEVANHLVLAGEALDRVQQAKTVTLQSYRSIDFYGSGSLGSAKLENLVLSGTGIRGYQQGSGSVVVSAGDVVLSNSLNLSNSSAPATISGGLIIDAKVVHLGANQFSIAGYGDLSLNADRQLLFDATGAFATAANLNVNTPLISGAQAATFSMSAANNVVLEGSGAASASMGGLGASLTIQGASISSKTDISLPSGQLTLRATNGDLEVGGDLSVAGTSRFFDKITRTSDAGSINLESHNGDVTIQSGSDVSVAADPSGGKAGWLTVVAPNGQFSNSGNLQGGGSAVDLSGAGLNAGNFRLDVGGLESSGNASFSSISTALDKGGFHASRNFRLRNGDVTLANVNRSHEFDLSVDSGGILVTGVIDASGQTGGAISLSAHGNITLASGALLTVGAQHFDSAGKGGSILLEAGTQQNGAANENALLDLQSGSELDLGVKDYVPGAYTEAGSSAFEGKFTGTLHLRAPRTVGNDDVRIDSIDSRIVGASSILVEGFKVYTPDEGILNRAQRSLMNSEAISFLGGAGSLSANEAAMRSRLLGGAPGLDSQVVLSPGVEMINLSGDLTLGLANNSSFGTTNVEGLAAADWDLSSFRYGSRSAPGVLTLRASGDLVFNNTLSDGFVPVAQGTLQSFADSGHSLMWLGKLMTINDSLPTNTQSWSYRLTAGADMNASSFRDVVSLETLDQVQPLKGSVIVGEFYPAVPNTQSFGNSAGIGAAGQTADSIRISLNTNNRGNRFEVVRTGTGDITISAGRDVQLRNQFSSIYTAGVALPTLTTVYHENDFVAPVLPATSNAHPSQGGSTSGNLGAVQQLYPAAWSMAGGNISLLAQNNIGRYTLVNDVLTLDSTRQMPTNWLYRRGYVDSSTGLFASDGGVDPSVGTTIATNVLDTATSTTWWIDYSNFFQGVGALGGGNVNLAAGNDVLNVDAVSPTNARMAGRMKNPEFGIVADAPEFINLAPDADNLLEFGGGDVTVTAGRNIDGGIYYVEKGRGSLFAGGSITTNASRSISLGILDGSEALDPLTWLPTTLFVGKSQFDVVARGDVLLGPATNPFLLPQGVNNKFWYKSYFNTFSTDAGVNVASYGGDVTHRMEATNGASSSPILDIWFSRQNLYSGEGASDYQPWIRLAESDLGTFSSIFSLGAPDLRSTSFGGDLNLAGSMTLFPSATGTLELIAASNIIGLQSTGEGFSGVRNAQIWTASSINVSDASPELIPGITTPLAYQGALGRGRVDAVRSGIDILQPVSLQLGETGSSRGLAATSAVKYALHGSSVLHSGDRDPVRLYAASGDVTGLTLFSPKETRVMAGRDITDVAFYLQNVSASDVTLVSAGRDIVPFNENAEVRAIATNVDLGNVVGDNARSTVAGESTSALAGDIQINGPGVLEVLSGRNLDLGTGANFDDGTGVGITSIGNTRNPNLPFGGADIIALAGVSAADGLGPADGLSGSSLDMTGFIDRYLKADQKLHSAYLKRLGSKRKLSKLTSEQRAIVALETFYKVLRDAGRNAAKVGNYKAGYRAVKTLFGNEKPDGEIVTRAREIRTTSGGAISVAAAGGGITMASAISGNPLTPPGIVTEYGGAISTFTNNDVEIGQARIFTLRGGDITMWSSNGNIAAGTSPKTVVTAPPTRVVIDITSGDVQTDLGGLATGGGIGVLAAVEGVKAGNVDLIAPKGFVDAGDAGIRVTGNLNIAAQVVLNSSNISAGGTTSGAAPAGVSAPSVTAVTSASNSGAAAAATTVAKPEQGNTAGDQQPAAEALSVITVEVVGYGGGGEVDEEDKEIEQ